MIQQRCTTQNKTSQHFTVNKACTAAKRNEQHNLYTGMFLFLTTQCNAQRNALQPNSAEWSVQQSQKHTVEAATLLMRIYVKELKYFITVAFMNWEAICTCLATLKKACDRQYDNI